MVTDIVIYFAKPANAHFTTIAKETTNTGWFALAGVSIGRNETLNRAVQDVVTDNSDPKGGASEGRKRFQSGQQVLIRSPYDPIRARLMVEKNMRSEARAGVPGGS